MQSRKLTKGEEALISLIEANSAHAKPTAEFIEALNDIMRNGFGANVSPENRINFDDENGFIPQFCQRLFKDTRISSQAIFTICVALLDAKTFGSKPSLDDSPFRCKHVFNQLYLELAKRHGFKIEDDKPVPEIPDDLNAIHYEVLKIFSGVMGEAGKQSMCNALLTKVSHKPEANKNDIINLKLKETATTEQVAAITSVLKEQPKVSQEYFDNLDKDHKKLAVEQKRRLALAQHSSQSSSPLPSRKASTERLFDKSKGKKAGKDKKSRAATDPVPTTDRKKNL